MTENNETKNNNNSSSNDVLSDLESLSQKYGLSFNADKYRNEPASSKYSPVKNYGETQVHIAPKNNTPAGIPRIIYDNSTQVPSLRVVYDDEQNSAAGPEGRRVIYKENEGETIAEKRRRNALAQKTAKGSQGFGSQPYVKHVASSSEAISKDDADRFTRTYETNKNSTEIKNHNGDVPVQAPHTSARLVAKNPESNAPVYQHYEKTAGEKAAGFFRSFIPWKGDSAKEVIRKLVMNISAIVVICCFAFFVDNYMQHHAHVEEKQQQAEMQTEVKTDDLEQRWAEIYAKYPDIDFPEGMNIRFAELYARNQDLVGWLTIENTNIDTSVLHHIEDRENDPEEEDYYLHRNFYKEYDKYGNPYLDQYNAGSQLDKNNVIYGHNMTDGLSFAQLEKYYTIDGFKESPIIKYSTLYEDYYFKVYATIISNGYHSGDNGYMFDMTVTNFVSDERYEAFIEAIDERKLYDTGVDINKDDRLITLVTCSYEIKQNQMGRLAVIGRLVRPGESTQMDLSAATINENPRYPQIWYDEKGIANPFADAYQWVP